MGGILSGRRSGYGKATTGACLQLSSRRMQSQNLLRPGHAFTMGWDNGKSTIEIFVDSEELELSFVCKNDGERKLVIQHVRITWTDCHFGGRRPWFICPIKRCRRRVERLYYSGGLFACRHCHNLTYVSQQSSARDRAFLRADAIRDRLGWAPGIANGIEEKPKGMHLRTYWRILRQYNHLVNKITGFTWQKLEQLLLHEKQGGK